MERSREVDNALNSSMAEYCLRWNNHQPNLVSVFSELLSAETLTDVTLAVDGKYIYAHKLVLSACSDYFKELFAGTPCKHPIVIFKDVKIEDLKTVVDFVYRGEVNISQDRLQDVMKTGEMLKIKGLSEKPKSREDSSSHPQGGLSCGSQFSARGRSSLTDPREHSSSLEDEKSESAPVAHMPKKRRLTPHTSSESTHDREEEAEPRSRGSSDIKEEESEEVEVELELQEEDPAIKSESGLHLSGNAGAEDVGEPSEVGSLRQSDISCSSQVICELLQLPSPPFMRTSASKRRPEDGLHAPCKLPANAHGKTLRKRCRECFEDGRRRDTIYYCEKCPRKPALCLGTCFKKYHNK